MKIAAISDTHGEHNKIVLKKVDLLIHCGDFARNDFSDFLNWFGNQEATYKILVAGNNDHSVMQDKDGFLQLCNMLDIIYLEDDSVTIEGVKIYGSPWTPRFCNSVFAKDDLELYDIFEKIDPDTNILVTHGPAYMILDKTIKAKNVGSSALKSAILKLRKLTAHFFGHVHENHGIFADKGIFSINCSYAVSKNVYYVDIDKDSKEVI